MHESSFKFAVQFKLLTSLQAMTLIDSTASFEKRCSDIDESGGFAGRVEEPRGEMFFSFGIHHWDASDCTIR